jgi:hypothetical protein
MDRCDRRKRLAGVGGVDPELGLNAFQISLSISVDTAPASTAGRFSLLLRPSSLAAMSQITSHITVEASFEAPAGIPYSAHDKGQTAESFDAFFAECVQVR